MMEKIFIDTVNKHRGIIYKICNLYCDDQEDRKDLFQEIILQLWKGFPSFRGESSHSTWMYRVALNTAISNFKKEKKRPRPNSLSDHHFQIPDTPSFAQSEDLQALNTAISKLNEVDKAIIILYLDENSYDEIADIIGITRTNVGVRINRIKTKLENLLKSDRS